MKNISRIISLSLVFVLLFATLSISKVSAESNLANIKVDSEDVEELAYLLEVLFEESIVYNSAGNPIGFDKEVLNEKVLTNEYSYLVDEFEEQGLIVDASANEKLIFAKNLETSGIGLLAKTPREAWVDQCILNKLNDSYGVAALTGIITAIKNKQWTNAASRLIKQGVKAAPVVIIANLGWILGSCLYEGDKRFK